MNTCAQMGGWWGEKKNNEKKKKEKSHSIFLFCSFSVFKEQMCRGLQSEKDTPLLLANLG